jgi:hypothetical protein
MARKLSDLLKSIPTDDGRNEILELARQVHEARRKDDSGPEQRDLLQKMSDRILWHLRAARYAPPIPDELLRMIDEHFAQPLPSR